VLVGAVNAPRGGASSALRRRFVGSEVGSEVASLPIVGRAGGANGPAVAAIDGTWSSASLGLGVAL
jgi:hypothetical protein